MEYPICLESCIAIARQDRRENDAALFAAYPSPSEEEWSQCLKEVTDLGDSLDNPHHCMGRYELKLHKRGVRTVLGELFTELREVAINVGLPLEYLTNAMLLAERARLELPHGPPGVDNQ